MVVGNKANNMVKEYILMPWARANVVFGKMVKCRSLMYRLKKYDLNIYLYKINIMQVSKKIIKIVVLF